jgi:hypothetical protein
MQKAAIHYGSSVRTVRVLLLYFVVRHSQDVVLLDYRFDCARGSMWWASIENRQWIVEWEIEQFGFCYTLFSCKAFARYCAPWAPIWLYQRFSAVSVYRKKVNQWLNLKKSGLGSFTLFSCKPLARYCAPWSPILLCSRFSVVSPYRK